MSLIGFMWEWYSNITKVKNIKVKTYAIWKCLLPISIRSMLRTSSWWRVQNNKHTLEQENILTYNKKKTNKLI